MYVENKLDLGRFIRWDKGENFPFNACMARLSLALGLDAEEYTYSLFAGVGGDSFAMCYGRNERFNDCLSVCEDAEPFLARALGEVGIPYSLEVAEGASWPDMLGRVREDIDRGVPVLIKSPARGGNYDLICGYAPGLLSLTCGDPAYDRDFSPDALSRAELVFVEAPGRAPDWARAYRNAVSRIPALLAAPRTPNGVFFGAEAFVRWADDVVGGRYDELSEEAFDQWRHWTIYVCNFATNSGFGREFLLRAGALNPDMQKAVAHAADLYGAGDGLWKKMEAAGGGFNITLANLKNRQKRAEIAGIIREFAPLTEEIARVLGA